MAKQVLQNVRTGKLSLTNIPPPLAAAGQVLIANQASLISAGTEKTARQLAQKSLLGKARERPDHVRRVIEKAKSEGLLKTIRQVRDKLDEPMTLGYSSTGVVLACGAGVQHFKPGDRVASNGSHGEIVSVPVNLCARVGAPTTPEEAAFAVVGAIALQGVRLSHCQLGEVVAVIGLGLVGQLTVAMLKANGCHVIGTDPDKDRCVLATSMGADLATSSLSTTAVEQITNGRGVDAVIITASTASNGPIDQAAQFVRRKGRIVLVGVAGLTLDRRPFYFKECEFVVSCSYGPGRYDANYEERGIDYPAGFVRWTEQRNIQAVLDMMQRRQLDVTPLISHRFDIGDAEQAYQLIETNREPYLGIILTYPGISAKTAWSAIQVRRPKKVGDKLPVAVLGAGNFAKMVMIPEICRQPVFVPTLLCSAGGISAADVGAKHGFSKVTSDEAVVFDDAECGLVFVLTRHNDHARQVLRSLQAGKHVFVEKPLCLNEQELTEINEVLRLSKDDSPMVMVGFNRRFSPAARHVRDFFQDVTTPLTITYRFNAGAIPPEHWTQQDEVGGGRIIGEACHAIDLATYLTGSPPVRVFAESVADPNPGSVTDDQCHILLRHANGSVSQISYVSSGDKAFPKERVEVFGGGQVAVIDDFREVVTCRRGKMSTIRLGSQDKGHRGELEALASCLQGGTEPPITWGELQAVTLASILAIRSIREGYPLSLPTESDQA